MKGKLKTSLIMNIIIAIIAVASGAIGGYLFEKMTLTYVEKMQNWVILLKRQLKEENAIPSA